MHSFTLGLVRVPQCTIKMRVDPNQCGPRYDFFIIILPYNKYYTCNSVGTGDNIILCYHY